LVEQQLVKVLSYFYTLSECVYPP